MRLHNALKDDIANERNHEELNLEGLKNRKDSETEKYLENNPKVLDEITFEWYDHILTPQEQSELMTALSTPKLRRKGLKFSLNLI